MASADRDQTAGWMSAKFISRQVHLGRGVHSFSFFLVLPSEAASAAAVGSSVPLSGWRAVRECKNGWKHLKAVLASSGHRLLEL